MKPLTLADQRGAVSPASGMIWYNPSEIKRERRSVLKLLEVLLKHYEGHIIGVPMMHIDCAICKNKAMIRAAVLQLRRV